MPRYRCLTCRKTFSRNAFSTTYYLKRPELLVPVAAGLVAGSAHRQIARTLGCAPSTVTRLSYRIGRHCLLFHRHALAALEGRPLEPVVFDHLETFEFSQDLPVGIATPVGRTSWFVYDVDPAPHRRAGRMSPTQRERVARRPPRPRHGGYDGSTKRSLDRLLELSPDGLDLVSDKHPGYRRVVRRHPSAASIRHEVHANPERGPKGSPRSAKAVRRDRAMFACDVLHGLMRHSMAAHRRETIAFGRRLNALMLRANGMVVWRNFVKRRSERTGDDTTPAMTLGLTDRRWTWGQVLAWRRFPERDGLDAIQRVLYEQRWPTPVLCSNAVHALRYAY